MKSTSATLSGRSRRDLTPGGAIGRPARKPVRLQLSPSVIGTALGLLAIVVVWQGTVWLGIADERILPTPLAVVGAFQEWMFGQGTGPYDGTWLEAAAMTGQRVLIGFSIAASAGLVVGVLIGYFKPLYYFGDPIIQVFRPIPAVAWVPLSIVIFGFSASATIFLIAYGTFFPIVINTAAGVRRSQREYLLVGEMLGLGKLQLLRHIVLPAALPSAFVGLRLGVGLAWILAIVGEMVAVRSGLGYSLMNAYSIFRYDIIVAAMISFAILGFASDKLIQWIESRVLSWRKGYDVAS